MIPINHATKCLQSRIIFNTVRFRHRRAKDAYLSTTLLFSLSLDSNLRYSRPDFQANTIQHSFCRPSTFFFCDERHWNWKKLQLKLVMPMLSHAPLSPLPQSCPSQSSLGLFGPEELKVTWSLELRLILTEIFNFGETKKLFLKLENWQPPAPSQVHLLSRAHTCVLAPTCVSLVIARNEEESELCDQG